MEISGGELITGGNLTAAGVIVWQLVRLISKISDFIEDGGKHRAVVETQLKAIAEGIKKWSAPGNGAPRVIVREASGPVVVEPSGEHPTQ